MTQAEIAVDIERWRARHNRWWYQRTLVPFLWSIVGLFYRHKSIELELNLLYPDSMMSNKNYYKYPPDFLFKWRDFLKDGKLHLRYFPRWWGKCKRGFLVP